MVDVDVDFTLLDLPEDMIFEVINHLALPDAHYLLSTCMSLYMLWQNRRSDVIRMFDAKICDRLLQEEVIIPTPRYMVDLSLIYNIKYAIIESFSVQTRGKKSLHFSKTYYLSYRAYISWIREAKKCVCKNPRLDRLQRFWKPRPQKKTCVLFNRPDEATTAMSIQKGLDGKYIDEMNLVLLMLDTVLRDEDESTLRNSLKMLYLFGFDHQVNPNKRDQSTEASSGGSMANVASSYDLFNTVRNDKDSWDTRVYLFDILIDHILAKADSIQLSILMSFIELFNTWTDLWSTEPMYILAQEDLYSTQMGIVSEIWTRIFIRHLSPEINISPDFVSFALSTLVSYFDTYLGISPPVLPIHIVNDFYGVGDPDSPPDPSDENANLITKLFQDGILNLDLLDMGKSSTLQIWSNLAAENSYDLSISYGIGRLSLHVPNNKGQNFIHILLFSLMTNENSKKPTDYITYQANSNSIDYTELRHQHVCFMREKYSPEMSQFFTLLISFLSVNGRSSLMKQMIDVSIQMYIKGDTAPLYSTFYWFQLFFSVSSLRQLMIPAREEIWKYLPQAWMKIRSGDKPYLSKLLLLIARTMVWNEEFLFGEDRGHIPPNYSDLAFDLSHYNQRNKNKYPGDLTLAEHVSTNLHLLMMAILVNMDMDVSWISELLHVGAWIRVGAPRKVIPIKCIGPSPQFSRERPFEIEEYSTEQRKILIGD